MPLSKAERRAKLERLRVLESFRTVDAMLRRCLHDKLCSGICIHPSCDYVAEVARDEDRGYCPNCETLTVTSALMLAIDY